MVQNQGFKLGALFRALCARGGKLGALLRARRAHYLPRFLQLPRIVPHAFSHSLQRVNVAVGAQGHFLCKLMDNVKKREKRECYIWGDTRARNCPWGLSS